MSDLAQASHPKRGPRTPSPTVPPSPVLVPSDPAPVPESALTFVMATFAYLLDWYEGKAQSSRRFYLGIKVLQLIAAAGVSATAVTHGGGATTTAVLGGVILVPEGVQQAFQFHDNWIRYRSTHTALLRTLTQWEVRSKPFDGAEAVRELATTLESLAGNETAAWARSAETPQGAGSGGPPLAKK